MKSNFLDSAMNSAQIVLLITVPQKGTYQRVKLEKMSKWIQGDWVKHGECGLRIEQTQMQMPALLSSSKELDPSRPPRDTGSNLSLVL